MSMDSLGSRAIIGSFYAALEAYTGAGWINPLSMFFGNSDQASEEYKWLGMSPALREWVGGRQAKGLKDNGITIKNKTWEGTLVIPVDWLRRDKTGQIQIRINELAGRAAELDSKLVSTLIVGGGTTGGECYDGQYFFDTDHAEGSSGTQTNALVASDYGTLNVGTPAAPTVAEMNAAILSSIQHIYGFKDDQGEPMNSNAKNFLVMVPTNMMGAGMGAVYSRIINASIGAYDNTMANAAAAQGFNVQCVVNPRLTSTTKFFVFRTDAPAKPFIRQEELPLQVDAIAEGSEEEFKNNQHLYGVKRICNAGYGYWQYAVQSTLS